MYSTFVRDNVIPLKGVTDPKAPRLNLRIVNHFKELKFSCVAHASLEGVWRAVRSVDRGYTFVEPARSCVLKIGDTSGCGTKVLHAFDDGNLVYEVRFAISALIVHDCNYLFSSSRMLLYLARAAVNRRPHVQPFFLLRPCALIFFIDHLRGQ